MCYCYDIERKMFKGWHFEIQSKTNIILFICYNTILISDQPNLDRDIAVNIVFILIRNKNIFVDGHFESKMVHKLDL